MSKPGFAIAVVDDEKPVRTALGRLLRAAGLEVWTFGSGQEFLTSLEKRRPDCAILDLHLPGLSGLDLQLYLSRERAGLPCIIITGKDEPGTRERVLAAGAAAYLKKPFDEEALFQAISMAVPGCLEKESRAESTALKLIENVADSKTIILNGGVA